MPRPPAFTLFPYTTLFRSTMGLGLTEQSRGGLGNPVVGARRYRIVLAQWSVLVPVLGRAAAVDEDRKSTRLNSSHSQISYAVFCLKKNTGTPSWRRA